ncbi:immunoglobulin A1 protease-like isoform X2 [Antennarius striatus]|uniref:immunoglobulin A1 protease-like isoform X2 n=1 Tax=Antennarius striatus TaxID=241820 RepID=UPI0035B3D429
MMPTVTSSYEVTQAIYEDPDALMPTNTGGGQTEVKVRPVPPPRLKKKTRSSTTSNPANAANTSNTVIAADSQLPGYLDDDSRPRPVRPPQRPTLSSNVTSSSPIAAVDGNNYSPNPNTETNTPDFSTDKMHFPPPRPERPRLPSNYYDRLSSMRTAEVPSDDRDQCIYSSIGTDELSPSYEETSPNSEKTSPNSEETSPNSEETSPNSEETSPNSEETSPNSEETSSKLDEPSAVPPETDGNFSGYCNSTTVDRPVVPPRSRRYSLPRAISQDESPPSQVKPPLRPNPPSSVGSVYSEIEYRPYLDILPEDEDDTISLDRSSLRSGQSFQSGSSHRQTLSDTEDINVMLRWLQRVSKNDFMDLSLYGLSIEEEMRSFHERAMNVKKALRLYNFLMMKRHDNLRVLITEFSSISVCLDKMRKKNKTTAIAGGTTGAVGGVTAVLGIALAPVTLGVSLIATAVGAGMVASAGGMGAHATKMANKKIVNRMAVEKLVYEYKSNIVDIEHCLDFILSGMTELRRHDIPRLQRAGAPTDVLKVAHLSQFVLKNYKERKSSVTNAAGMSSERLLLVFSKELDQYFPDNHDQKLRKSKRSRFSGSVRLLAENLQVELDYLNQMWEMLS